MASFIFNPNPGVIVIVYLAEQNKALFDSTTIPSTTHSFNFIIQLNDPPLHVWIKWPWNFHEILFRNMKTCIASPRIREYDFFSNYILPALLGNHSIKVRIDSALKVQVVPF
jgi:hypothetical protein